MTKTPTGKTLLKNISIEPSDEIFNNITYREYHEKYNIQNMLNNPTKRNTYLDNLGNHIEPTYYKLLQNVRLGKIDHFTWNTLQTKLNQTINSPADNLKKSLNTTHIVEYKEIAEQINQTICNKLPTNENKYTISNAIDIINGKINDNDNSHLEKLIKQKTNLPKT
ncbi:1325_t:CDS:2, partial [Funneliformis geosporum]